MGKSIQWQKEDVKDLKKGRASSQRLCLGCANLPHCNLRRAPVLLNNLQKSTGLCHENQYVIQLGTSFARCHQLKETMGSQGEARWECGNKVIDVAICLLQGFKIVKIDSNVSCGFWSHSSKAVGGAGGCLRWDLKWKSWGVWRLEPAGMKIH